jgi:hypothetical protein
MATMAFIHLQSRLLYSFFIFSQAPTARLPVILLACVWYAFRRQAIASQVNMLVGSQVPLGTYAMCHVVFYSLSLYYGDIIVMGRL